MVQAKVLIRSYLLPIGEVLTIDPGSTAVQPNVRCCCWRLQLVL